MVPIQCNEISSTMPDTIEDEDVVEIPVENPDPVRALIRALAVSTVHVISGYERLTKELETIRKIANEVVCEANGRSVTFFYRDDITAVFEIDVQRIIIRWVQEEGRIGIRIKRREYCIRVIPFVSTVSAFLELILQQWDYTLTSFVPKSLRIGIRIPMQKLKVHTMYFESNSSNAEDLMDYWVPFLDFVESFNVGDIEAPEHEKRCFRIYRKWFQGRVTGWFGRKVPVSTANILRREIPNSTIDGNLTPIGVVIRWIKGWSACLPGYTHINRLTYRNSQYSVTDGIFRFVGAEPSEEHRNGWHRMNNTKGGLAYIWIRPGGILTFFVEQRLGPVSSEKGAVFKFGLDDLADIDANYDAYLEKDRVEYQNVEEYGTPKVQEV